VVSVTVTPLARTVLPSGLAPALVEFKFARQGLSATVVLDVREALEVARILTSAAKAAEALEPVLQARQIERIEPPEDGGAR